MAKALIILVIVLVVAGAIYYGLTANKGNANTNTASNTNASSTTANAAANTNATVNVSATANTNSAAVTNANIAANSNVSVNAGSSTNRNTNTSAATNTSPATKTVTVTSSGFSPSPITVKAGDTIRWLNDSGASAEVAPDNHPTHTKYAGVWDFTSASLTADGGSYSRVFSTKGTFTYHNHLDSSMTATIIVE